VVSCLGHGHPDVLAATRAQLDKLANAHSSFFTARPAEELAHRLVAQAPPGMWRHSRARAPLGR
jgi:adenosylmethionine-8-amino-7-oxononanoate aminotransferase